MLGFTTKYVRPQDGAWGKDEGNLTWNGMVGMLQRWEEVKVENCNWLFIIKWHKFHRNEADVGTAGLSATLERSLSIDFTNIVLTLEVGITLPKIDSGVNHLVVWPGKGKWDRFLDALHAKKLLRLIAWFTRRLQPIYNNTQLSN